MPKILSVWPSRQAESIVPQPNYLRMAGDHETRNCLSRALALSPNLTISELTDIRICSDLYKSVKFIALVKTY